MQIPEKECRTTKTILLQSQDVSLNDKKLIIAAFAHAIQKRIGIFIKIDFNGSHWFANIKQHENILLKTEMHVNLFDGKCESAIELKLIIEQFNAICNIRPFTKLISKYRQNYIRDILILYPFSKIEFETKNVNAGLHYDLTKILQFKKNCCVCGHDAKQICSMCNLSKYCSSECQKLHWVVHKFSCLCL